MNRQAYVKRAIEERAAWLEDVLAGLLINGVAKDEIEIREFYSEPARTEVWVRGKLKYGYRTTWRVGK